MSRDLFELRTRLEFHKTLLEKLRTAYLKLLDGGVKSYTIDDRSLTRFDLDKLKDEIAEEENTVDELNAELNGLKPRRAFGVLPRDW
ncbi:MAG: hypothetical protein IJ131_01125 [Eggerthellaceae bacterium]|nr:hypothetical protein [Eggerthellaceae bacterium]